MNENSIGTYKKKKTKPNFKHMRSSSVNTIKEAINKLASEDDESNNLQKSQAEVRNHFKTISLKENKAQKRNLDLILERNLGYFNYFMFGQSTDISSELSFEKTKRLELLFQQRNLNSTFQFFFALISITAGISEYEISYRSKSTTLFALVSLIICSVSSVLLGVSSVIEYFIKSKIRSATLKISESIWTRERYSLLTLFAGLFFLVFHPSVVTFGFMINYYNNKYDVEISYSLNNFLLILLLTRLWFFIKFLLFQTEFSNDRMQRICEYNGFNSNILFALKAYMRTNPIRFYAVVFLIILVYHSYLLRIFERDLDPYTGNDFANLWNAFWCMLITMFTVGFGDLLPSTLPGRIVGISGCIFGVFLISLSIVTITNVFVIEGAEKNIYTLLKRVELSEEKDKLAKRLLTLYLKAIKFMRKNKTNLDEQKKEAKALKDDVLKNLFRFREVEREMNMTYAINKDDEILDSLNYIEDKVDELNEKIFKVEEEFEI